MSTKRRIGVSVATTEAARRQLMQPVTCWEKVWVSPEISTVNPSLKVLKWVRTEKIQNFSDDEGQVDEPLAPLPDEPEIVEGDDDEQDDNPVAPEVETTVVLDSGAVTQEPTEVDPVSKPPSPKAELLMTSTMDEDIPTDGLDLSLKSLDEGGIELVEGDDTKLNEDVGMELDISALGPDGLGLEASNDLSQLEPEDAILGGPLLDDTPDPFADNIS